MKNKALVVDLDDTLYAEIDFLYSAYKHIARRLAPERSEALFNELAELYHRGENAFQYLVKRYDVDLTTLLDWYRFHVPQITLFPHVKEQLNRLKSDYRFALVTDGRSVTQRNKVKALGLEPLLDFIVISEEVGSEKPDFNNYRLVQEALQCRDYIYIGDNPKKDFVTPNRLGWKTICLRDRGTNIHKQDFEIPHEFRPHFYMSDWSDLPTILNF